MYHSDLKSYSKIINENINHLDFESYSKMKNEEVEKTKLKRGESQKLVKIFSESHLNRPRNSQNS